MNDQDPPIRSYNNQPGDCIVFTQIIGFRLNFGPLSFYSKKKLLFIFIVHLGRSLMLFFQFSYLFIPVIPQQLQHT